MMTDTEYTEQTKQCDALWEKVKAAKEFLRAAETAWLEIYNVISRERQKRELLVELKEEGKL